MNIVLLEPYYTGSHARWAEGLAQHSRHRVHLLTLNGYFWKWRMHGGAVTLAREFMAGSLAPDVLLATDMLDLTTFLALTRGRTHHTPAALYMHENQLTYPLPAGEKRDLHYGFINYASMLAAERIFFNSAFHLESFFDELPRLLKHFPDYNELPSIATLRHKSAVLPVGIDLARFDAHRPAEPRRGPPLILWNHRWEYDKNPEEFFQALYALAGEGVEFQVALAGENFRLEPREFDEARGRLGERIVHCGYIESFAEYARLLWRADILPVTSWHDFFGVSVVEALYCETFPLLPARLSYPELVGPVWAKECLYRDFAELVARLRGCILNIGTYRRLSLRSLAGRFDWSVMAGEYDARLEELCPTVM